MHNNIISYKLHREPGLRLVVGELDNYPSHNFANHTIPSSICFPCAEFAVSNKTYCVPEKISIYVIT
jgi:hypothetical protein